MKPYVSTETATPWRQAAADNEPETLSVAEAAERAGISRTLIYEALSSRLAKERGWPVLPSISLGGRRLVRLEALRAWLLSLERGHP